MTRLLWPIRALLDRVRSLDLLLAVALAVALLWALAWVRRGEAPSGPVRVVDGDTLVLAGRTIRLAGMDAPELRQTCGPDSAPYRCGERARDALRELTRDRPVSCRTTGRDRYGRDLAVCRAGGTDLGADLVRRGLAVGYRGYAFEETLARLAGAGIWAGPFERPEAWRRNHGRAPAHMTSP